MSAVRPASMRSNAISTVAHCCPSLIYFSRHQISPSRDKARPVPAAGATPPVNIFPPGHLAAVSNAAEAMAIIFGLTDWPELFGSLWATLLNMTAAQSNFRSCHHWIFQFNVAIPSWPRGLLVMRAWYLCAPCQDRQSGQPCQTRIHDENKSSAKPPFSPKAFHIYCGANSGYPIVEYLRKRRCVVSAKLPPW